MNSAPSTEAINLATVDFLLSEAGRAAAAELADAALDDAALPGLLTRLRRRFPAAEAGALVTLARLRRQAAGKFPAADRLFFTAEALEQATAAPIAAHRATWIADHAPPGSVLDLGCGIGGDTLALARHRPVIAYELDPLRLRLAQANVAALDLPHPVEFRQADWTAELDAGRLPPAAAAFADPARRQDGKRLFSLHTIQPPLSRLLALQAQVPALGAKVMPGVDDAEIPAGVGVEFISHEGTCKEAVLWFGPLAGPGRWASVHTPDGWLTLTAAGTPPPLGDLVPGQFLYEPDPAVIRAGAFVELCARLDAHLFDPQIAYLVGEQRVDTPLAQRFRILEVHPFGLKPLQARLNALGVGQVELKKRGAPFAPESLRGRLKLAVTPRAATVLFTRRGDERLMIIAERS
jgi:SAM-dependent methyltransferase